MTKLGRRSSKFGEGRTATGKSVCCMEGGAVAHPASASAAQTKPVSLSILNPRPDLLRARLLEDRGHRLIAALARKLQGRSTIAIREVHAGAGAHERRKRRDVPRA